MSGRHVVVKLQGCIKINCRFTFISTHLELACGFVSVRGRHVVVKLQGVIFKIEVITYDFAC